MSRGPGIWQRRILAVLEVKPVFYLRHLLPSQRLCGQEPTRAQKIALVRAANTLEAHGRLMLTRWASGDREIGHIMVSRPGVDTMAVRRDHNASLTNWGTWREILSVVNVAKLPTDNT